MPWSLKWNVCWVICDCSKKNVGKILQQLPERYNIQAAGEMYLLSWRMWIHSELDLRLLCCILLYFTITNDNTLIIYAYWRSRNYERLLPSHTPIENDSWNKTLCEFQRDYPNCDSVTRLLNQSINNKYNLVLLLQGT